MSASRIVQLALPVPLRRLFDYRWPEDWPAPLRGQRVSVPFGRQQKIGVVWGEAADSKHAPEKLQTVTALLDRVPLVSAAVLDLLGFAAHYYQHPLGDALSTAFPVLLRAGEAPQAASLKVWCLTEAGRDADPEILKRAPRQRALWQVLFAAPAGILQAELLDTGFDLALLRQLGKRGWVEAERLRIGEAPAARPPLRAPAVLNAAQHAAVEALRNIEGFSACLLEGVTGSGKTEVYLQLIAERRARGRQALVLIPEIGLTPQTERRFRERFGDDVVVLHSALSDKQRWQAWEAARSGKAGVVLGTRSALFVSLPNPGLLIVDEEHDLSFKQQEGFRYHARDLAVRRAQLENIPVVLGSATPSLESLHNVQRGRYRFLHLPDRANAQALPDVKRIDLRKQALQEGLSPALIARIREHLARDKQVLLFLNRRGFSPSLLCHDCGWLAECRRCDSRYTVHLQQRRLRCHHCLDEQRLPDHCPKCHSKKLLPLGLGTERIEDALKTLFPDAPIARIDRDTTRGRDGMQRWVDAIRRGDYRILLGTQMLAKGHDFPNVTLAALIDVDSAFFATDYRAQERLAQLITQVAGRAGRGVDSGEVLLQTHQPDQPLLHRLIQEGYRAWADAALQERAQIGLPPITAHVLLRAEADQGCDAESLLQRFKQRLRESGIVALGPVPAPMAKRANRWRFQLLIETEKRGQLQNVLQGVFCEAEGWPEARRARWQVDVDPQDMM